MFGNVQILTYENPYNFDQKQEFQPYRNCPHICATKAMASGVKNRFCFSDEMVMAAGDFLELFYPGWNQPETRFTQYTQLSDLLRGWEPSQNSKVLRSFKRNKLNLLNTMRSFSEMGMTSEDLRSSIKKAEEKLFCELWEKMEPYFSSYKQEARKKIQSLDAIRKVFEKAGSPLTNDTVVLHGFYYLSPVQHYLFTKWKERGVKLVFLTMYHEDYPSVFSFLEENFSEKFGWCDKPDWNIMKDDEKLKGSVFASRFEGKASDGVQLEKISEKSYEYMVEFVEDIREKVCYVSPNNDVLKERIKEFRPEAFEEDRHFLAYPIGQYLFHLHSLWDEEQGDYILTNKILMESFASGWLYAGGENSREYTVALKSVLPYFTNCQTADDWIEQLNLLIKAKRLSGYLLKKHKLDRNEYLKAVRVSPVLRFSYFSVPLKTLKYLKQFLEKLVNDAKWLVNIKEERIWIKTHFQRIQQLLNDSNLKASLVHAEEKQLVAQLESMLQRPIPNDGPYHVADLADAIALFLKNGLKNEDPIRGSDVAGEDRESELKKLHLFKMADVDGLILRKGLDELHLCGLDEHHFPETTSPVPWPLSFGLIEKLEQPSLAMFLFRKRHALSFSKYLFYCALCYEGKLQLSWVKNWNQYEKLDKSVYMELLDLPDYSDQKEGSYGYVEQKVSKEEMEVAVVQEKFKNLPNEEFSEMSLCKKRFFYSSIVDGFSTYRSPFHQSFLIGNLVKIYAAIGKTKAEIIKMLEEELFPYMTEISLRTIVDQNMNEDFVASMKKYGLGKRRHINGIDYPESMLYFQFLTHRGAFQNETWQSAFSPPSGFRRQKGELIRQIARQTTVLAEGSPSVLCKLCPHSEYCEDAYYSVDITKKGFDDHDAAGN